MNNKFSIGSKVIRKLTETEHVVEDISFNEGLETLHPSTGEFGKAKSPWNYKISGYHMWIVEDALIDKPDDWVDPNAATKKKELVK